MGFCLRITLVLIAILAAIAYQQYQSKLAPISAPYFDVHQYWGPGDGSDYKEDDQIQLQKIVVADEPINNLIKRLNESIRLHPPLEGIGFEYGFNTNTLSEIITYWRDDYLPRWHYDRQHFLNLLPHFITEIQGLKIHYVHTKAGYDVKGKKVVPLLLIHGWPGSIREFYDIIPKFATPNDHFEMVFEVVAPSIPGYGWSDGAAKPGLGTAEVAVILRNLMIKLGYDRFYIQGGDWGSVIGSNIATLFPDNVIGYHSNMCFLMSTLANLKISIASMYPSFFVEEKYHDFYFPYLSKLQYMITESGYLHLQASKPDTIGTALSQNPVGLAAYILEKFSTWTNPNYRSLPDGGLFKGDFTKDALLDNIMIYYLSNSITTSVRLYAEELNIKHMGYQLDRVQTTVPTGCAKFKNDLAHVLDWQIKDKFPNLVHSAHYNKGGHFIAMELPDVLFKDFAIFIRKVKKAGYKYF